MDIEDKIAQSTFNDSNLSLLINREMENISLFQKILRRHMCNNRKINKDDDKSADRNDVFKNFKAVYIQ